MRYLLPFLLLWAMPVWAGGSRASDSTDDYIEVADNAALDVNDTGFSVGIWVKGTAADDGARLLCKGNQASDGIRYEVVIDNDGAKDEMEFNIDDNTTKSSEVYTGGDTDITDGTWHFWEFIRDTSANELSIFKDAVLVASPPEADGTGDIDNTNSLLINDCFQSGTTRQQRDITGNFAYFQLYKDTHGDDERHQAMHMPCSRPISLELCLPLWGQDSPEEDLSVNQLTGTVTGMTEDQDAPPVFLHSPYVQQRYQERWRLAVTGMPVIDDWLGVISLGEIIEVFHNLLGGNRELWCERCHFFHSLPSS